MLKKSELLTNAVSIFIALLFISLFAQISFSLPGGIPFSGQSFAILSVAIFLGWKSSLIAVILYLTLGAFGVPILAGGSAGFSHFLNGSGGYFVGFLVATLVVGWLKNRGADRTFFKSMIAFLIGHVIILFSGAFGIYLLRDYEAAIEYGLKPFIVAAFLKSILGGLVMPIYYENQEKW